MGKSNWWYRFRLFFNNRIAEPIHAHIRKVLDVPSHAELIEYELRLNHARSTFLQSVETAEEMLLGREEALHRFMTQVDSKLSNLKEMDVRVRRREESAARIQSSMEEAASKTTLAIYDASERLLQVQDLLRKIKEYEEKRVKEKEAQ
jgi:Na+/phosphate symporter